MLECGSWLRSLGFDSSQPPPLDGTVHRIDRGKSGKSGWFIGWKEPFEFAIAGDWRTGERFELADKVTRPLTPDERREREAVLRRAQQKALAEREERAEAARLKADIMMRSAVNGGFVAHDYLLRKKIALFGARVLDNEVLVPCIDADGNLWGVQRILVDGQKFFLPGQRFKGTFHRIHGDYQKGVWVCEGYATGASIHMATGAVVYCSFSAGNLPAIAELVAMMHPGQQIGIAGDDDKFSDGNAGRAAALRAGELAKARVVFPAFKSNDGEPTDFNDLHCREGLEIVAEILKMHDEEPGSPSNVVNIGDERKKKAGAFSNYDWAGKSKIGVEAPKVLDRLKVFVGDWPRRVGRRLFVVQGEKPTWLARPCDLLGWISGQGVPFDWREGESSLSKSEFVSYLSGAVTEYDGISALPHFPPRPKYFYPGGELPPDDGAFEALLDFFKPATPEDGLLLKAAFMTLFWGGPPGARPAFVFTGIDGDSKGGRGVGKSALTDAMAHLAGGAIDFSASMKDFEAAKKRLLTSSGERIVRFDNVKADRLSNGDIEGLITAPQISGHLMFVGEGKIQNDFTYLFTFNDISFSKDMAQRAVQIRLDRPNYLPNWTEELSNFISDNKMKIIAGIGRAFEKTPATGEVLRFAQWTRDVLFRVVTGDPAVLVAKVMSDQLETDDDEDQGQEIGAIIQYQVSKYSIPETWNGSAVKRTMMIRGTVIAQWVKEGLGLKANLRSILKMVRRARLPTIIGEREYHGYGCLIWRQLPDSSNAQATGTGFATQEFSHEVTSGAWHVFEDVRISRIVENYVTFKERIVTHRPESHPG